VALSAREHQVLKLVSKGFTTEEAAQALGVSRTTVLTFVRRIYAKLQVGTRAEAIHEAHRKGLLAD
jgi:DNA-binding CsgD family transcriptional regulator